MVDELSKEYRDGLQIQKNKTKDSNALDNIKKFYRGNKKVCQRAYDYYRGFNNSFGTFLCEPTVMKSEDFADLLPSTIILVLTVNPIERDVFLRWLYDQQREPLFCYMVDNLMMTLHFVDDQRVIIHVNTNRTGEDETRVVLNQIRKIFSPTYLFMLGICYGLNMSKYSIGSVFISDSVSTFRMNFRDELDSDETRFEAEDEYNCSPDRNLIQKISQFISYTVVHSIVSEEDNPTTVKSEMGKFLSSNSLVSSHRVKQAVMDQYANRRPKPLGGEMEAAGILKSYIVEEDGFSNWIIIKSVCDWGEKKNLLDSNSKKSERIKDSLQAFAMTNTCGAFERVLKLL